MKRAFNLLVVPIGILLLWALVSHLGVFNTFLLPPPEKVFRSFIKLAENGELWRHVLASTIRVVGGFALASVIALPLAYFNFHLPTMNERLQYVLEALRFIPPLSLIPLLILWLGIGEASKITIVVLSSFFPIYLNSLSGFRQLEKNYFELSQVLKLDKTEHFKHIEFPGALPNILTGLRLGFGYSWRALVGAELIAASSGLGYLIGDASELSQTDKVFVGIICIAVLGIVGDQLFEFSSNRLFPWKNAK